MPPANPVHQVTAEWVQKAEDDFLAAYHLLLLGDKCPTDIVCFHAQQCVEKYLKAYLTVQNISFPRTHDIGQPLLLLPESVTMDLTAEELSRFTGYATTTRYPGEYDPVSLTEAHKAIEIAQRVKTDVRKLLPRAIVRRQKAMG